MRAIIIKQFGGADSLVIENLPDPEPKPGEVLIEVKAFGINHAETHMRKGEWAEAAKVSGIECVGVVKSCPDGQFSAGTKVAALMGGLGRTINGSYAEYTRTFLFRLSSIKLPLALIKRNRPASFNLPIFARRTRQWNRTKPMAKWWFASETGETCKLSGNSFYLVESRRLRFSGEAPAMSSLLLPISADRHAAPAAGVPMCPVEK